MSVANPIVGTSRNTSYTVSLAPYLVETLCELTRAVRDRTHGQTELSGLLFGRSEDGLTVVDALKTFEDSGPRSDLAKRERLAKAFEATLADAYDDPELAPFKLVGWFSLRSSSGLLTSDVDFHNRHFKSPEDLALVVWREADTQVIAELYSKADNGTLSSEDYRWSSVRLSSEMRHVTEPIDLAMRVKVNEDSYLRAYQSADKPERRDEWKKIAWSAQRSMRSLLTRRPKAPEYSTPRPSNGAGGRPHAVRESRTWESGTLFRHTEEAPEPVSNLREASRVSEPFRSSRPRPAEVSGLPMVINTKQKPQQVPWISTALVFFLFSAFTFAILAVVGMETGSGKLAQIMRVIFPGTDLGMHVESQGDRLLLSWNRRNPAVAAASDGTLQIFDGLQHREVRLDGGQIADGSVLYKPVSGDVTFRLEVHGAENTSASGSMRVLDATNSAVNAHEGPVTDVSNPEKPPATAPPVIAPATVEASKPNPPVAIAKNNVRGSRVLYHNGESKPISAPPAPESRPRQTSNSSGLDATAAAGLKQLENTPPAGNTVAPANTTAPQSAPAVAENSSPAAQTPRSKAERAETQKPSTPSSTQPLGTGSTINPWDGSGSQETAAAAPASETKVAFVPPRPLLQVMPNTRSLSPGLISQVTRVEVEVRIDEAGRVASARVLNDGGAGKPALTNAAVSAAKQWTFQPATLKGEKVESQHTIVFEFRPETQP
jgi:TonB family protein